MAVLPADIVAHFPNGPHGGIGQATYIQLKIDEATAQVNPAIWGAGTDNGIRYLTMHLIALEAMSASLGGGGGGSSSVVTAGPVTSEKVGDVARSYGGGTTSTSSSSGAPGGSVTPTTSYGEEYFRLRGLLSTSPIIV